MKKILNIIPFILLTLLLTNISLAQTGWIQQNSGTTTILNSVFFLDDNTGWTCGWDGIILKTTNSGLDWFEQNSNTSTNLHTIQFVDENTGWVCGNQVLIKTSDGGSTWDIMNFPSSDYLSGLQFINLSVGWIISHNTDTSYAYKTTNGGIDWNVKAQYQSEYFET